MNLTIEQMRKIVDGAPEWAQGFCFVLSVYAASSKGSKLNITCLDDIRKAIADHDRIDTCSDIRNHVSPNTRVSEHNNMHCQHGYDVACLICGFGTVDGKRVWHNKAEPKKGDRVKVDFVGESATIYSGKRFTGYGVLDRVEAGRVFGRLDDGTPFMCLCADVEVIEK